MSGSCVMLLLTALLFLSAHWATSAPASAPASPPASPPASAPTLVPTHEFGIIIKMLKDVVTRDCAGTCRSPNTDTKCRCLNITTPEECAFADYFIKGLKLLNSSFPKSSYEIEILEKTLTKMDPLPQTLRETICPKVKNYESVISPVRLFVKLEELTQMYNLQSSVMSGKSKK